VLSRSVNPGTEVFRREFFDVLWSAPAHLGGNHDRFASLFAKTCDQPLAAPVAVDVGRVEEGHTGVGCGVQRAQALLIAYVSPVGSDRPCAEADLAGPKPCLTQRPGAHQVENHSRGVFATRVTGKSFGASGRHQLTPLAITR